jgi:TonB family protein
MSSVNRHWLVVMPGIARGGQKGRVAVEFDIMRDGAISGDEPTLHLSSGAKPLDSAAMIAIRASAPFQPLPPGFFRPSIRVRFTFGYNLPPGQNPRSAFNIPCRY